MFIEKKKLNLLALYSAEAFLQKLEPPVFKAQSGGISCVHHLHTGPLELSQGDCRVLIHISPWQLFLPNGTVWSDLKICAKGWHREKGHPRPQVSQEVMQKSTVKKINSREIWPQFTKIEIEHYGLGLSSWHLGQTKVYFLFINFGLSSSGMLEPVWGRSVNLSLIFVLLPAIPVLRGPRGLAWTQPGL